MIHFTAVTNNFINLDLTSDYIGLKCRAMQSTCNDAGNGLRRNGEWCTDDAASGVHTTRA